PQRRGRAHATCCNAPLRQPWAHSILRKPPPIRGGGLGVTFSERGWTGLTGLEPATSGVTDRHSNQLSYSPQPQAPHGAPEYRPAVRSIQRRLALERVLDRRLCPLVLR